MVCGVGMKQGEQHRKWGEGRGRKAGVGWRAI